MIMRVCAYFAAVTGISLAIFALYNYVDLSSGFPKDNPFLMALLEREAAVTPGWNLDGAKLVRAVIVKLLSIGGFGLALLIASCALLLRQPHSTPKAGE